MAFVYKIFSFYTGNGWWVVEVGDELLFLWDFLG